MMYRDRPGPRGPAAFAAIVLLCIVAASAASAASASDGPESSTPAATTTPASAPALQPATVPAETAGEESIRLGHGGSFDLKFRDTDLTLALRLLSTQSRKNIITTKEVSGVVTADLYGVTFKEALEAVLRSGGYVYQEKGNFIYIMTAKQLEELNKSEQKPMVRTFRLSYVTATDAKILLAPALSTEGSIAITPASEVGIKSSKTESGGNSNANSDLLVVRDYEDNLRKVEEVLLQIDSKPQQVLIEATILRATLTEDTQLGIDFNTLAGINFSKLNSTTTGLTNMVPGTLTSDKLPPTPMSTGVTDFTSGIQAGGLTIGFISPEISMFIRALEGITDVTVMANPKLLVVNKQRGEVMVGNRDGYVTTTFTETVASQAVQFLETGTRLIVRPFIGKAGNVRLEIHPEDSSGSVQQTGNFVLPSETTTEVTSNVLIRDGHTIVIGGLFRERTSTGRSQVPAIGNIPYLGTLFRRTIDNTVREEVIILITPRIICQEKDEAVSEQLRDDIERYRVGQRKGMQWFGRERLAQYYLRMAKQDLASGRRDLAMWNTDVALSLEPRFDEAIRIKEQMTEKAYWADESQESTARFIVQRMMMNEMGKPFNRVIPPGKPLDAMKLDPEVREAFDISPRIEDPVPEAVPHRKDLPNGQIKPAPRSADDNKDETVAPAANGGQP